MDARPGEPSARPGRAPARSGPARSGREYPVQLVGRRDLELVVAAVPRLLVRPPPQEDGGVAEAVALQMVVLHLADALDAQGFPGEVLAGAPAALRAGHALERTALRVRPFPPRMVVKGILAERRQLLHERPARRHRERGRDADVLEHAARVVESQEQRADRVPSALV